MSGYEVQPGRAGGINQSATDRRFQKCLQDWRDPANEIVALTVEIPLEFPPVFLDVATAVLQVFP